MRKYTYYVFFKLITGETFVTKFEAFSHTGALKQSCQHLMANKINGVIGLAIKHEPVPLIASKRLAALKKQLKSISIF